MSVALAAEDDKYAYFGVADHLIVPRRTSVRYAYTEDGVWPGAPTGECFDAIATLAFVAAITSKIKLLTSVLVLPHRPAVLTAKLLTTVDVLSGGRVVAGIGAGWMKEEFAALNAPPYDQRGTVTDEYLTAWKALWTQDHPQMAGTHVAFDNVVFRPPNLSRPHPPIWVGGESPPSIRRAARLGDAWYPLSSNAQVRMDTPESLKAGIDRLHRAAEKAGRDPAGIDIAYLWFKPPVWQTVPGPDGKRQCFTGSGDDMLEDAAAFEKAGVRHLIIYLQQPTLDATLEAQQRFAEDVVRKAS
jgi:probable F420-dependent oxidoreductase